MFTIAVNTRKSPLSGNHCVYESYEDLKANFLVSENFIIVGDDKKVYYSTIVVDGKPMFVFGMTANCKFVEDWKDAQIGDWAKTSDNGYVLCVNRTLLRNKLNEKHNQPFVRFSTGYWNCNPKYNYFCSYKQRKTNNNMSKRLKGDKHFTFKSKHEKFVISFALTLNKTMPIEEIIEDAWFSINAKSSKYGVDSNYTIKLKYFMWHVLKHDKAIKLLNRYAMGNDSLKDLLANNGLTKDLLVKKVVEGLKLPATSHNAVSFAKLGFDLHEQARLEEKAQLEEDNKRLNQAENASFRIEAGENKPLVELPTLKVTKSLNEHMMAHRNNTTQITITDDKELQ